MVDPVFCLLFSINTPTAENMANTVAQWIMYTYVMHDTCYCLPAIMITTAYFIINPQFKCSHTVYSVQL